MTFSAKVIGRVLLLVYFDPFYFQLLNQFTGEILQMTIYFVNQNKSVVNATKSKAGGNKKDPYSTGLLKIIFIWNANSI